MGTHRMRNSTDIENIENEKHKIKDKAVQSQACTVQALKSSRRMVKQSHYRPGPVQEVRVHRFGNNGTWMVVGCQPYAPAVFNPRKYSWYSFLLQAESTPGP